MAGDSIPLSQFYARLGAMRAPRVLEAGVRKWDADSAGGHRARLMEANPQAQYVGLDLLPGDGVDVVADLHEVASHFDAGHFDAIFLPWIMEHVRRPWIVAAELAVITRPGGLLYVGTHQSFPYHPYPADYWRFSREALAEVFAEDVGWRVVESAYAFPCKVVPLCNRSHAWNFEGEAWEVVDALVERR